MGLASAAGSGTSVPRESTRYSHAVHIAFVLVAESRHIILGGAQSGKCFFQFSRGWWGEWVYSGRSRRGRGAVLSSRMECRVAGGPVLGL